MTVQRSIRLALDLLLQVGNDRGTASIIRTAAVAAVAGRKRRAGTTTAVDFLPERAQTGGFGAEGAGGGGTGGEELFWEKKRLAKEQKKKKGKKKPVLEGKDMEELFSHFHFRDNSPMKQPTAERAAKPAPRPRGCQHPRPSAWSRKPCTRCKWRP